MRRDLKRVAEALALDAEVVLDVVDDVLDRSHIFRIRELLALGRLEHKVDARRVGEVARFGEEFRRAVGGVDGRGIRNGILARHRLHECGHRAGRGSDQDEPRDNDLPLVQERPASHAVQELSHVVLSRLKTHPSVADTKDKAPTCINRLGLSAVAAGFEPAVGDYPTLAFEASTFGRSDTPPRNSLKQT